MLAYQPMAPQAGYDPATPALTAPCTTSCAIEEYI